jgi:hypothetical protein
VHQVTYSFHDRLLTYPIKWRHIGRQSGGRKSLIIPILNWRRCKSGGGNQRGVGAAGGSQTSGASAARSSFISTRIIADEGRSEGKRRSMKRLFFTVLLVALAACVTQPAPTSLTEPQWQAQWRVVAAGNPFWRPRQSSVIATNPCVTFSPNLDDCH